MKIIKKNNFGCPVERSCYYLLPRVFRLLIPLAWVDSVGNMDLFVTKPTPVLLPGESQGWGSLVGCRLWGHTELNTTEVTQQQHNKAAVCQTFSKKANLRTLK